MRARPFSYAVRGLDAPSRPVAVVLTGPGGERWAWDEDSDESITGPALDFCLVVTQRRHHDDTDLEAVRMTSSGLQLVLGLARQLRGTLYVTKNPSRACLDFPAAKI